MHMPVEQTPPPAPIVRKRRLHPARWLFWVVFAASGISAAAAIHINGLPLPDPAPVGNTKIYLISHRPPPPPVVEPPPIVIRAVGDVVLGSNYPRYRLPGDGDKKRIAALHHTLNDADVVVGNLEGVLYDHGKSRKDVRRAGLFTFRMPESYAATLREMGFDVLSLANNHSMDFGAAGLEATKRALLAEGIQPVGVPGAEMALVTIRNTKIAFLNYSYLPAFTRLDKEEQIKSDIEHARSVADLVMVTVHAGREGESAAGTPEGDEYFMNEYRGNIRKFAQFAIDSGASAVFGHGPHVVRPYEIYKDKPIFFSLGNFVGYRSLSTRGKMGSSIVAEVRFSPKGKLLEAGVIPLKMNKSGIPSADYSLPTLSTLDGLLDKQLEKRPVLKLAAQAVDEKTAASQPVVANPLPK
ncbi:MAG TPA: CapA family protein [Gallionellaceae bacterium]|nr:CapA family protein [Gallionellaceae bacterium]